MGVDGNGIAVEEGAVSVSVGGDEGVEGENEELIVDKHGYE